jgi:signal transduction histidine kinase/ligand-binding sensor domain-containing protein
MANGFQLPSDTINLLYNDKESNIWIGTARGLIFLSPDNAGIYHSKPVQAGNIPGQSITCIMEDEQRIWFGTVSGTLFYRDKLSNEFLSKKVSVNRLNGLCLSAKDNTLYISTAGSEIIKLNRYSLQTASAVMPGARPFYALYEDKSGQLWIEPAEKGVVKFNPLSNNFKYFFQKSDMPASYPLRYFNVKEDYESRVWVFMKGGGLGYYDPVKDDIQYLYNEQGAVHHRFSNSVICGYFDPSGILWFSTSAKGIEKVIFQGNDFNPNMLVDNSSNNNDNDVRGIYNDRKNRLWLASKSGKIYIRQPDGRIISPVFINAPSGGIGMVYTILQQKNGKIWLGTKGRGLYSAEPVDKEELQYKLIHYQPDKNDVYSLNSNLIYTLLEDRLGRLWVGTFENGLNLLVYKDEKAQFINAANDFKRYPAAMGGKIRHLKQDEAGNIWVATTNGLVIADINKASYKSYEFLSYQKKPGDRTSLGNNNLQFILRDSKGRMWIATSGGGLNEVIGSDTRNLRFKIFTREDGLPSDYILSIVEDNMGNLWLGTENGLSKFTPDNLHIRNYDSYDGLPKTGFSEACALKLQDGNLLFGTISGYLIFNPSTVVGRKIRAAMAFTNFQVNNKDAVPGSTASPLHIDINNTGTVHLRYNENIISIDFTVLDYRSNNKQAYAYRLAGFDEEWHSVINQHKATYTNLHPGKYQFDIKSLNDEIYENLPAKTLLIVISPPWWRTTWAYIVYALLLIIIMEIIRRIAFTMIRLRNRIAVEKKLTDLKINFFTNISHELRTPLTLIVNPVEEVLKQDGLSAKSRDYLTVARKNTNRMVRFINQLLDFQKVQSGKMKLKISRTEMVAFVKEIASYFSEAAHEKQIELKVTSNLDELYAWVDPEKIDIVIYNLLSNALKFSGDGKVIEIQIDGEPSRDFFTISVIDQGIGVPPEQLADIFELYYEVDNAETNYLGGTGIGLALSKDIVRFHHGKIYAYNNSPKGLMVTVELRLGKDHFQDTT